MDGRSHAKGYRWSAELQTKQVAGTGSGPQRWDRCNRYGRLRNRIRAGTCRHAQGFIREVWLLLNWRKACGREAGCSETFRRGKLACSMSAIAVLMIAAAGTAQAQPADAGQPSAAAESAPSGATKVSVELNKLESQQSSCRAYLVIDNQSAKSFDALKLDLVLFQTDGIIGRRFALDLAPIKVKKRSVKLFDLDGVKCETIGSFLINDVMDCKAGGADESGCMDLLALSTRSNVQLSK